MWYLKVAATFLKLQIRLRAHWVGTNIRCGTDVIFTLIWLAHVFGIRLGFHIVLFQA